jgi:hypothetical protein
VFTKPVFASRLTARGYGPRPAHDQGRVGEREQALHAGDEIWIGLHSGLVLVSVQLISCEEVGNVQRHIQMADENALGWIGLIDIKFRKEKEIQDYE